VSLRERETEEGVGGPHFVRDDSVMIHDDWDRDERDKMFEI
jgi:hypothetical protein